MTELSKLFILCGPASVGKGPTRKALRLYERLELVKWRLQDVLVYKTRKPRPGEVDGIDHYFAHLPYKELEEELKKNKENREEEAKPKGRKDIIDALHNERILSQARGSEQPVVEDAMLFCVRDSWQALDLDRDFKPKEGNILFLELYYLAVEKLIRQLNVSGRLVRRPGDMSGNLPGNNYPPEKTDDQKRPVKWQVVYLSPVTSFEAVRRSTTQQKTLEEVVAEEVKERIRWRRLIGISSEGYHDLQSRAADATVELAWAKANKWVTIVPSLSGEGHPDWGTDNTLPIGNALQTVETVRRIITALSRS